MSYKLGPKISLTALSLILFLFWQPVQTTAQTQEPEVMALPQPKTPLSEGKHNALGVEIMLNNFGVGLGGHYSRVVGPFSQLTLETGITGLRDVSEQTYTNPFFGQQIIPNKYNRAMAFPILLGIKHRFFARQISDNFRFFAAGAGGPVLAFIYPYFNDINNNGFRDSFSGSTEPIYDFFSGWSSGTTKWGVAGEFKLGVDIGENFTNLTTVEFGYYFYYFQSGIQMMEPNRLVGFDENENPVIGEFQDPHKYFGTPQITLTFGGMW